MPREDAELLSSWQAGTWPPALQSTLHNLDDWARGLRQQLAPAGHQDPP